MCFSYKGLYSQMRRGVIALASGVTVSKGSEFYARTHTPEIVYLMVYKTPTFLDGPMMKTKGAHTTL